ncbi:MAG: DNA-binding response regulator [Proteobacteria bacterium]|nr:MAG: DNA-binding response regulator [Pseudomonadota bacterium]
MMSNLLLVEDDESLGATLTERLEKEGYSVSWAKTKQAAVTALESPGAARPPDLVILDIGLPDGSGIDLARDLKHNLSLPIIFLSAMNSAEYRLEGFELGAEDYVPKPFHLKELLLRIARVMERSHKPDRCAVFEDFKVDFESMQLIFSDGATEFLAQRDIQLLKHLIEVSPRVVGREEILSAVWQEHEPQSGRSVDNAIVRLRQALSRAKEQHIRSVRGVGYQWI